MQYWTVNTEDRVILTPLPPILGGIFGGIFWWYILERPKAEPKYTTKIYHQKYHPISGNIARGVAECDISRYQTRKSSRVKYPTHPEGRLRPLAAPARGMCGIFHEGWFPSLISLGSGVNITRSSVLTVLYCLYYVRLQDIMLFKK